MPSYSAKSPGDVLDYRLDAAAWLAQMPGDAVTGASVAVSPVGRAARPGDLVVHQQPTPGPAPSVWLREGLAGTEYAVVWTLATAGGRTKTATVALTVA